MIPMGLPTTQHQLFPCVQGRQTFPKPITLNRSPPIVESYVHLVSTISNVKLKSWHAVTPRHSHAWNLCSIGVPWSTKKSAWRACGVFNSMPCWLAQCHVRPSTAAVHNRINRNKTYYTYFTYLIGCRFFLFFFVFQSGALFLAICYILERKPVLCWILELKFAICTIRRFFHGVHWFTKSYHRLVHSFHWVCHGFNWFFNGFNRFFHA